MFIAFRVLFNARWYYPVLAVLFLDFGLSVEEYALLNVAWAAAIVGLEVPSGALADQLGRKRMVVFAAALMVVEMAVFAFAPRGNPTLLFVLFLVNRVLSGAAEASASGADEALAYDSLVAEGRASEWPAVLERLMRWQAVAFFVTMMAGAAAYDANFVQGVCHALGLPWKVTPEMSMRFPIYLTLGNAVLALLATLNLREPGKRRTAAVSVRATWRVTFKTGRWIAQTPLALGIILAGMCFDSIVRLFLTLASNYYRLISVPEAAFGFIGSAFAVIGFLVPALARKLVRRWGIIGNFAFVALLTLVGLLGTALVWPLYGLLWLVPLGMAMSLTQFYISHYLNQVVTDSRQRATVLSFRGLAFNLAYGGVGLLFAALTRLLAQDNPPDDVFVKALGWLPWYFVFTVAVLAVSWRRLKFL
ncbi:MAG TPA: MFS transporter [Terrimicrobiaceae bacterium]|nr:MFS transporter [Terrimicrobiaceae bacterium]